MNIGRSVITMATRCCGNGCLVTFIYRQNWSDDGVQIGQRNR